ncbi:interleukin-20 receptor subunit beta isoform 2-T2 [Discoglossus pictus]
MGLSGEHLLRVMLVCLAWVSATLSEETSLPAPENITMESTNLNHLLSWDPVPVTWGNVTYSVQFQGKYEREYNAIMWNEVEHCQAISITHCSVTNEIGTNTTYTLQVRAMLDNLTSNWSQLQPPFSRTSTVLTPPDFEIGSRGHHLIVDIKDLGKYFEYFVFYWKKGQEHVVHSVTTSYASDIHLNAVEGGSEYCAQVIAHAGPIYRNSSRSVLKCTEVPEKLSGLIIGIISLFGAIAGLALLSVVLWYVFRLLRYSCCPRVDTPDLLVEPYSHKEMVSIHYSAVEKCEEITSIVPTKQRLLSHSLPA